MVESLLTRSKIEKNMENWNSKSIIYVIGDEPLYVHIKVCRKIEI